MSANEVDTKVIELLESMRKAKPEERGELSRRYAVAITELEKLHAYFVLYVLNYENKT